MRSLHKYKLTIVFLVLQLLWYIVLNIVHMHTHTHSPLLHAARRPDTANTQPLRDSVDFSDLLENSEEREEDRKKK